MVGRSLGLTHGSCPGSPCSVQPPHHVLSLSSRNAASRAPAAGNLPVGGHGAAPPGGVFPVFTKRECLQVTQGWTAGGCEILAQGVGSGNSRIRTSTLQGAHTLLSLLSAPCLLLPPQQKGVLLWKKGSPLTTSPLSSFSFIPGFWNYSYCKYGKRPKPKYSFLTNYRTDSCE